MAGLTAATILRTYIQKQCLGLSIAIGVTGLTCFIVIGIQVFMLYCNVLQLEFSHCDIQLT
jgi:hypothetical protein